MPISLFALALTAFVIGMTEFLPVGILPVIAQNLDVSIATAGLLITGYALSVTIAAPLVTALTMRVPRKQLMLALIALFIAGNLCAALAVNYTILLAGRLLTGIAHGVFFAISVKVAMQLVPTEKQARAISIMFSGLTLALVMGVPLGTFIGNYLSWRFAFYIISAISVLAFISLLILVPNTITSKSITQKNIFSFLRNKAMLFSYLLTMVSFGAPFIAYTYLTSILTEITGFQPYAISAILVLYGISVSLGNILGGRFTDRFGPLPTIKFNILLLALVLIAFGFAQHSRLFSVITIAFWGGLAFAIVPSLQFLVMKMVARYKVEAEEVASGTNIAAFNLGISGGSFIGSIIVSHQMLSETPFFAGAAVLASFIIYKLLIKHQECISYVKN